MKDIVKKLLENKNKTVPILSFPSANMMGISVGELINSAENQMRGMIKIRETFPVGASLNMMDLSVEAEAFGAEVRFYEDEIPTVKKGIIEDVSEACDITVPKVGEKRDGIYIEGVKKAKEAIGDIPVFCGVIGPYSLASRLFDMTELMMECFDSPDDVHILLEKVTEYLTEYIKAFKQVGADGVIMAEPAAGLLSPDMAEEFSNPYVQKIIDAVNSEDFAVCYHNCGESASDMFEALGELHADIFHFGNEVNIEKALRIMPQDKVIMGNVNPVLLKTGCVDDVQNEVEKVYNLCGGYPNFMISTGCDVPSEAKIENIKAYFEKVCELYEKGDN